MWCAKEDNDIVVFFQADDPIPNGSTREGAAQYAMSGLSGKQLKIENGKVVHKTQVEIQEIEAAEAAAKTEEEAASKAAAEQQILADKVKQEAEYLVMQEAQKKLDVVTPAVVKGVVDAIISAVNKRLPEGNPITLEEIMAMLRTSIPDRIEVGKVEEAIVP